MTYLEDSGSSGDSIVSDGGVATSEHDVALACNGCGTHRSFWDLEGKATIDSSRPTLKLANRKSIFGFIPVTYSENTGPVTVIKAA